MKSEMWTGRKEEEKGERKEKGRVKHWECDSEGESEGQSEGESEQHRERVQGGKSGRECDGKGVREKTQGRSAREQIRKGV